MIPFPPCLRAERPITDEIRELAEQVASAPDVVGELGAEIASLYRQRRALILGMLNVDALVAGDEREIDERHPALVALREDLRDRLRRLLDWARDTERLVK